jgi:hypothetical protein
MLITLIFTSIFLEFLERLICLILLFFEKIFNHILIKNNTYSNMICGSNGIIYSNKCELDRDQCLKQKEIKETHLLYCLGIKNINLYKNIHLHASLILSYVNI